MYTGFPLTWKTAGRLLEFYVTPGIFGMITSIYPEESEGI